MGAEMLPAPIRGNDVVGGGSALFEHRLHWGGGVGCWAAPSPGHSVWVCSGVGRRIFLHVSSRVLAPEPSVSVYPQPFSSPAAWQQLFKGGRKRAQQLKQQ